MKTHVCFVVPLLIAPCVSLASPCGSSDVPAVVETFEASAFVKVETQEKVSRGFKPSCVRTVSLGQTCGENCCANSKNCGTKFVVIQSFEPEKYEEAFNAESILAFTVQGRDGKVFAVLPVNLLLKDRGSRHSILE